MRRQLLLAAILGGLAIVPAPASAHGPNAVSAFGVRIIVHDGARAVQYYHHPGWRLRPQPWHRHFSHPPLARWHQPWHRQMQHFPFRHGDHRPWFRGPGSGHPGRWVHAPWRQDRPTFRNHVPHGGFAHGQPRSHRRHDR